MVFYSCFLNNLYYLFISDRETGDRLSKIVDEACVLLAEYNGRLAAELEDRVVLSKMLSGFIALQKDKLLDAEKRLEVCRSLYSILEGCFSRTIRTGFCLLNELAKAPIQQSFKLAAIPAITGNIHAGP